MKIRKALAILALAVALPAVAQTYPARPIRLIVPYPAGGYYDLVARVISQRWGAVQPQPMVVENRAGANGIIASEAVAKAAPDGYTLILGGVGPHGINPALYPKLPYDAVRDFEPVIAVSSQPNVFVVHPSFPANTVEDFVTLARAKPGEIAYASNGSGSSNHLCVEMFASAIGIKLNHIPFKGASPAVTATLSGQPAVHFGTPTDLIPLMKAGKLRGVATTGERRAPALKDLPTIAEQGIPGYACFSWSGLFAPAGTPRETVAKLNAEVNKMFESPEVRERIAPGGTGEIIGGSPEALATLVSTEIARWTKVVRETGVRAD